MIYFTFILLRHSPPVNKGVKKNLNPGKHLSEDQPDVHHLHVGCLRKTAWNTDEQGGQDQEWSQVDGDNGPENEYGGGLPCYLSELNSKKKAWKKLVA